MGADATEHLAHAAELERRDEAVADELGTIRELADRAGAVRARATEIRQGLERIPAELDDLEARRSKTELDAAAARSELDAAETRLAELEGARRRRQDDLDRARREATTARERLADTQTQLERLAGIEAELRSEDRALREAAAELPDEAARVAADIRRVARVTETARDDPGTALEEIEEWGAGVRSALFVARGTLEAERERIVVEANALGTAVLGESLGGSSVAVVRRRLEERLATHRSAP